MRIIPHKKFKKQFRKLRRNDRKQFEKRVKIFLVDPFNPILNNHELRGKYKRFRSINITADLRVIYEIIKKDTVLFLTIDSHSNLYS